MKIIGNTRLLLAAIFLFVVSLGWPAASNAQNDTEKEFLKLKEQMEEASKKDLPRSVISICDQIISKAKATDNYGWLLWAQIERLNTTCNISPDSVYTEFNKLESECLKEKNAVNKMLLHTILAEGYAKYFVDRFRETNETLVEDDSDSTSLSPFKMSQWSYNQFKKVLFGHIDSSVADMELLFNTKSKFYYPLVLFENYKFSSDDLFRNAGVFFNNDLLSVVYFHTIGSIDKLAMSRIKDDYASLKRDGIKKNAIDLYRRKSYNDAVYFIELFDIVGKRSNYWRYDDKGKDEEYKEYEKLYSSISEGSLLKGDILALMAKNRYFREERDEAFKLCKLYKQNYQYGLANEVVDSILFNLKSSFLDLKLPQLVSTADSNLLTISFRNVKKVRVNRYKVKDSKVSYFKNKSLYDHEKSFIDEIKNESILEHEETIDLIKSESFQTQTVKYLLPTPSELGLYYYIFSTPDNEYEITNQYVTNLELIYDCEEDNDLNIVVLNAIVVDRLSGNPVPGATVKAEFDEYRRKAKHTKKQITSKDGLVTFKDKGKRDVSITVETESDRAYPIINVEHTSWYSVTDSCVLNIAVKLILDRSIYRPGQRIHFKGIAYNSYEDFIGHFIRAGEVLEKKEFTVILTDSSDKEICRRKLITNEYGSFSGSFEIPATSLNGLFHLSCLTTDNNGEEKEIEGSSYFSVEEYKRPSFEIVFDNYDKLYKQGDTITVTGSVKTLYGTPITDSDIKVFVENGGTISEEGYERVESVRLENNGKFAVPLPIPKIADNSNVSSVKVKVEVTSTNGETQSQTKSFSVRKTFSGLQFSNINFLKDKDTTQNSYFYLSNFNDELVNTVVCYELKNKKGEIVDTDVVNSNTPYVLNHWKDLPQGAYTLKAYVKDSDTSFFNLKREIGIFSFDTLEPPVDGIHLFALTKGNTLYYGSSFEDATVFIDISKGGGIVYHYAQPISNCLKTFDLSYKEEYGEKATVHVMLYRDGKFYSTYFNVSKPTSGQTLKYKWNTFRNKLKTGQNEKWSLCILDKDNKPTEAEMIAFMFDASLNKVSKYPDLGYLRWSSNEPLIEFKAYDSNLESDDIIFASHYYYIKDIHYLRNIFGVTIFQYYPSDFEIKRLARAVGSSVQRGMGIFTDNYFKSLKNSELENIAAAEVDTTSTVVPRSNFAETAFFYPQLRTDADGNVNIEFTLPESLTRWKFMALAHTKELDYGTIEEEIIAQKDFMVAPNMPRFLRRGDKANIASTIYNLTQEALTADVKIELFDPATEKIYSTATKKVTIGANDNTAVEFQVPQYPDNVDILGVRIIAASKKFSDGEQHLLSVLPNTTRVVESVPLTIRGNQTKTFSLESIFNHHSQSATNKALTVEYTGNPAWYAVMALPTLSQPESDNAVSWATSLYVNSISNTIVQSNPKIQNAIEAWKLSAQQGGQDVLQSKLFQNEELKNIVLNETPWVADAKNETEQMERISNLFNANNLHSQTANSIKKLSELQQSDGGWPWFKGMLSSRYITDYVLTLLARMENYASSSVIGNISSDARRIESMQKNGIKYLGNCAKKEYDRIQEYLRNNPKAKDEGISYAALRYLYILAITYPDKTYDQMLKDKKIDSKYVEAFNYFLRKVNDFPRRWDMQEKSMVAIVLSKAQRDKEAKEVAQSIREHLTKSDVQGMFFDFDENPWAWNRMKINAQTAAIEAINIVDKDSVTVEEMKLWLLNQKRTQDWGSTTTTADAIYSLLMVGENPLDNEGVVEIDLIEKNKEHAQPQSTQTAVPILNYVKEQFTDAQTVDAKSITVSKKDDGMAWGAVYATFNEKIDNVGEVSSQELSVSKELYVKRSVPFGNGYRDELQRITQKNPVKVGDIVTARMIIKVGREMEFVHLKDSRAVCFEPMGQLSGYRYGGGTWFYLEIKDAATNFFFERLSKGVYVLELNYRVSRTGTYSAGFATLQSAYAPDFSAHSAAVNITVE